MKVYELICYITAAVMMSIGWLLSGVPHNHTDWVALVSAHVAALIMVGEGLMMRYIRKRS